MKEIDYIPFIKLGGIIGSNYCSDVINAASEYPMDYFHKIKLQEGCHSFCRRKLTEKSTNYYYIKRNGQ